MNSKQGRQGKLGGSGRRQRFPGEMYPSRSNDFNRDFNADRKRVYQLIDRLARQVEMLSGFIGRGTVRSCPAKLYIEEDKPGRVFLEAGYQAVITEPVETEEVLFQGYRKGLTHYVYLVLNEDDSLSLQCASGATDDPAWLLIGMIGTDGTVDNDPGGKLWVGKPAA
jgi:hypothetical protein